MLVVSAGLILVLAVYAVYLQPCLSAGQQRGNSWPKNLEGWIYSHMVKKCLLLTYLKCINFLSELNKDEYSL